MSVQIDPCCLTVLLTPGNDNTRAGDCQRMSTQAFSLSTERRAGKQADAEDDKDRRGGFLQKVKCQRGYE